ncbi:flavin reductase [Dactylosporangium matsuzakiense]|uniref:Flavin reductase n=1 Tax=Dactylosporangium matsuzakiense TaxID=53360 RepID=A0A9W6NIX4_9ACTN|nr:flavin reductase [Dactylosporangium matsuzakiense]UWZ47130.1 flavin reductase [Dactylosporangium matsuzakiense]GLK98435.1 flavin reductase [Dactylosporangium matsuzakiense]
MSTSTAHRSPEDPAWFRHVLGQYPTGVCVITAQPADGPPIGMVVGSFSSVSMHPPLVGFYPSNTSETWPHLQRASHWCVNILAAHQSDVCRRIATAPLAERFEGVPWRPAPSGAPIIEGAVAWIDCVPVAVHDAGDHKIALAEVRHLDAASTELPLLFFRSGYGSFSPLTLTAYDPDMSLTRPLRHFELIRSIAQELPDQGLRCLVTAPVSDSVVVIGQLDPPSGSVAARPTTLVGQRLPFRPHGPSIFEAWAPTGEQAAWVARFSPDSQEAEIRALARIRERGFSIGLGSEGHRRFAAALEQLAAEPGAVPNEELDALVASLDYEPADLTDAVLTEARVISAPVFDSAGSPVLAMTVFGFRAKPDIVRDAIAAVTRCAQRATRTLGLAPRRD